MHRGAGYTRFIENLRMALRTAFVFLFFFSLFFFVQGFTGNGSTSFRLLLFPFQLVTTQSGMTYSRCLGRIACMTIQSWVCTVINIREKSGKYFTKRTYELVRAKRTNESGFFF
jgi:hypothetical protein